MPIIVLHSPQNTFRLPYAPKDMNDWTDEHYFIYGLLEEVLGNRTSTGDGKLDAVQQAMIDGEDWEAMLDAMDGEEGFLDEEDMTFEQSQGMENLHKEVFGGN